MFFCLSRTIQLKVLCRASYLYFWMINKNIANRIKRHNVSVLQLRSALLVLPHMIQNRTHRDWPSGWWLLLPGLFVLPGTGHYRCSRLCCLQLSDKQSTGCRPSPPPPFCWAGYGVALKKKRNRRGVTHICNVSVFVLIKSCKSKRISRKILNLVLYMVFIYGTFSFFCVSNVIKLHNKNERKRNRSRDNELTLIHPVNDGLHGALWGVTLQDNTVSLISFQGNFFFFLLGRRNCTEVNKKQMHPGKGEKGAKQTQRFPEATLITRHLQHKPRCRLSRRSGKTWYVSHACMRSLPPSLPLLITPQDPLKSASHDINLRVLLRKRLSGKLWGKEVAQERASHRWMENQTCSLLSAQGL